ncbi:MAG TPA: MDR family MFS transporter [Bacillota bacterium]|jgi:EmrB/QacA subfamily drug resistance transporter
MTGPAEPAAYDSTITKQRYRTALVVIGLMCGMLLGAIDQTVVATAMPTVVGYLGGFSLITWVTTAYMLTSTATLPIFGKLSDLYGRRLFYLVGLGLFMVGSALCGAAKTMPQLVLFRGLQGIGGGAMVPVAQTIIGDIFPGAQRARMQGVFTALFGVASILGPQVGGWIVDFWDWRWVFYINIPVGLTAAILIGLFLREYKEQGTRNIDYLGSAAVVGAAVFLLLGLVQGGKDYPWMSAPIIGRFAAAAGFIILFIFAESVAKEPILPLDLFKDRVFAVCNFVGFFMGLALFGAVVFVPLFMQGVVGISASDAGMVMTPMMFTVVLSSLLGGWLVSRVGYRTQTVLGMGVLAAGFYLMSLLTPDNSWQQALGAALVAGIGLGLVMPIIVLAVQGSFPKERRGVVTSSTAFFRSIGGTMGVAILGVIMNNRSAGLIRDRLAAMAGSAPPEMTSVLNQLRSMTDIDPQSPFAILVNKGAQNTIPAQFLAPVTRMLKDVLSQSIRTVFLVAMGVIIAGAVTALFMGHARLDVDGEPSERVITGPADWAE